MLPRLAYDAAPAVAAAIAAIGRTEDVRFSPDGRRMAIAGYEKNEVLLVDIEIVGTAISLSRHATLTNPSLAGLHGIDFVDDDTLVLANRDARVLIAALPRALEGQRVALVALRQLRGPLFHRLRNPGSVAVMPGSGAVTLFICDNYANRVNRTRLSSGRGFAVERDEVLLREGLSVPDGVALSPDFGHIAVSSHVTREVLLFANVPELGERTPPVARLTEAGYPHGLRFFAGGARLAVADAGSPDVTVYDRPAGGWAGNIAPSRKWPVLDEAEFAAGHANVEEGGPKGLDFAPGGEVMAISCEEVPLAFYQVPRLNA